MLAASLPGLPAMTTTASLPVQSFPAKPPIYPPFPNTTSFFAPFPMQNGYHSVHSTPMYGGGCSGASSNFTTPSSTYSSFHPTNLNHLEMNSHTNGLISPKHSHPIAGQLSPTATDESHPQRAQVSRDRSRSPIPTSSPTTGPLLSPNSSHPSSLTSPHIPKTTFHHSNGFSNNFPYGSSASTQHHLPQNNLSHTPSTVNSAVFTPSFTNLSNIPPVAPLPGAMPNMVMYSSHGQVDYNSPSINSSVNLWGQHYPNTIPKLSYDSPRYKLTPERATPLQKWFDDHKEHPYPTRHDKILLCQETNLTFTQVSTWFANCRRRLKKANQEEEERNNYNSYHEESSPQRPSSQSPQRPSSRSPGSESPESGRHDSDDKQNYSTVTPTLHADEFSVSCTYKSTNATRKH